MSAVDALAVERASKAVLGRTGATAMEITGKQLDEMILAELECTPEALEEHREVVHTAFLEHIQQFLPQLEDSPPAATAPRTVKKVAKPAAKSQQSEKEAPKKREKAKAVSAKSTSAPKAKESTKDPLARLKKYVAACGVRRQWKRELEGMSERQARAHIEAVLAELGVEGRPTLDKCKAVRERRDFESEIRELDPANVLGVRLRSERGAEGVSAGVDSAPGKEDDHQSGTPPQQRFNLLAYGDPEDDM